MIAAAFVLASCAVTALPHAAHADATEPTADEPGSSDSPLLQRYEGSYIVFHQKLDYTDFSAPLSQLERVEGQSDHKNNAVFRPKEALELEGSLTRLVYVLPPQRSPLEVLRNYQDVIEEAGGSVLYECKGTDCGGEVRYGAATGGGKMTFTQHFFYDNDLSYKDFSNADCAITASQADLRYFTARLENGNAGSHATVQTYTLGEKTSCKALSGRTIAIVHVLEPKARDKKMVVVEAAEMESALASDGGIALYGIFLDFDSAAIKAESAPTLEEIAKLLRQSNSLAVAVIGHTDNKGAFDYNIELSSRRAAAVRDALVKDYGIDAKRLTAAGAGMMAPVATNDTEEGRAKNRRVALVKLN